METIQYNRVSKLMCIEAGTSAVRAPAPQAKSTGKPQQPSHLEVQEPDPATLGWAKKIEMSKINKNKSPSHQERHDKLTKKFQPNRSFFSKL